MGSLFRFNPNGFHRFPPTSGGAYTGPWRQVHERVRRQAAGSSPRGLSSRRRHRARTGYRMAALKGGTDLLAPLGVQSGGREVKASLGLDVAVTLGDGFDHGDGGQAREAPLAGEAARQTPRQQGNGDDLVGLFSARLLAQHEALAAGPGGDQVQRLNALGLGVGAPGGLAVDRDDLGFLVAPWATSLCNEAP